jgi:hypothetical protein
LYYDQVLIFAGVPAVFLGLLVRRVRAPALAGAILVVMALRPGYLPAMYVIQALPFFGLAIAGVLDRAASLVLTFRADPASWTRFLRRSVVAVSALGLTGYVAFQWYAGDSQNMTISANTNYFAADQWIKKNVPDPAHHRIVVDDAIWLDMVHDGFQPGLGAIWFYKLDKDPGVISQIAGGWRGVDYVVSTPILRQALSDQPNVSNALTHSRILATFGTGDSRIEVRQVEKSAL